MFTCWLGGLHPARKEGQAGRHGWRLLTVHAPLQPPAGFLDRRATPASPHASHAAARCGCRAFLQEKAVAAAVAEAVAKAKAEAEAEAAEAVEAARREARTAAVEETAGTLLDLMYLGTVRCAVCAGLGCAALRLWVLPCAGLGCAVPRVL